MVEALRRMKAQETSNTVTFGLRVPACVADMLDIEADRKQTTRSEIIRDILIEHLENHPFHHLVFAQNS
jgi:metal-responsive CopG/Arc/MetJ family transcriptional regulator